MAGYATAVLYNGLGRYQEALAAAQWACEHEDVGFSAGPSLNSSGRPREAANPRWRLKPCSARGTHVVGGPEWALGIQARSRALVSGGNAAEALYREAIERLTTPGSSSISPAPAWCTASGFAARTSVHAREQLRVAHEMFSRIGAKLSPSAPAASCRRRVRRSASARRDPGEGLTAQEPHILVSL